MSEIFGNVVDVDTSLAALAILEDCVQRMRLRLWEDLDDWDERSVKDIDTLLRDEELDEYIDSKILTLARCIQIMTDRSEHGEKSHDR